MLFTALVMGFLGSLHCVGMCSPLAIAVSNINGAAFRNRIVYNSGRILSYAVLGSLAAAIGTAFQVTGLQNILSITLGCLLIITGLAGVSNIRIPLLTPALQKFTTYLKKAFGVFLQKKTNTAVITLGFLNGLLPCGLTYLALTYCITLPAITDGFIFMLTFGIATLPVMLGLTSILQVLVKRFRLNMQRITTVTIIALGVLLITRNALHHPHITHPVGEDGITVCR